VTLCNSSVGRAFTILLILLYTLFVKSRTSVKMKTAIVTLLFALLAIAVLAKAPQKPVIVSYPNDTPDSVLTEAKDAVRAAVSVSL